MSGRVLYEKKNFVKSISINFTKFLHTRKYDFGRVPKSYFSRPQIDNYKTLFFFTSEFDSFSSAKQSGENLIFNDSEMHTDLFV